MYRIPIVSLLVELKYTLNPVVLNSVIRPVATIEPETYTIIGNADETVNGYDTE